MSKLRNIILFLFGTHRLGPRPHRSGTSVAPIFLYPQKPYHEGATNRPRRTVKRPHCIKKGRGDAAFDYSSADDAFGSSNSGSENVTTPASSQADPTKSDFYDDEATKSDSIDDDAILDGSLDPLETDDDWSSTPPTTQPRIADPYQHYLQEEGVPETQPNTTSTTPSTQPPTYPSSTTPSPAKWSTTQSPAEWDTDPNKGPHLFPRQMTTTTTQPSISLTEFYNRSPKIPVRHNATSTLRQEQIQHVKYRLPSFSSTVKRRHMPIKYPWPVITQRDWREINGIRLWSDRFEKDEYIMEDGKPVKKYESKRWKQFVQEIKLSVDRQGDMTKIHMPLPLPEFIIDLIEEQE